MDRKKALCLYLWGTIGQILVTCVVVYVLRGFKLKVDYTTSIGFLFIGIGGISSALWGAIVTTKYRKISVKDILRDFINIRQTCSNYLLVIAFLVLDFCCVFIGGTFKVESWYIPIFIFLKAILFGGIEEIGWRYTFQPILEEKINYIFATIITFVAWGIWHFLYFYIEGSLYNVDVIGFLIGLFINCFILSALYNKTRSLWICVMAHTLINTFSQISSGGNAGLLFVCRIIIIIVAIGISRNKVDIGGRCIRFHINDN